MRVIGREQAKQEGLKRYFTGDPCKWGHVSERMVINARCVQCQRDSEKRRNRENPEQFRAKRKRYYEKNSEKQRKRAKDWYWSNAERCRKRSLKYQYRDDVRERNWKERITPRVKSSRMMREIRHRCKRRGLDFDLDREWLLIKLENGRCELTGLPFVLSRGTRVLTNPYAPSIDRVDPSMGYTKDNCRVILWAMNACLGSWGEKELEKIVIAFLNRGVRKVA